MNVGDVVRTKVPGFGTGSRAKLGTVIKETYFSNQVEPVKLEVLHDDGSIYEWYTWQLEEVSGKKTVWR